MNERIKELATYCIKNSYEMRIGIEDFERFAELIIQECLVFADQFEIDVNQTGVVSAIKTHFGIEE